MSTQKIKLLPFLMWLIAVLFFAFQFILRLWPSLMVQEIMQQLTIEATEFGLIAAFYYYGYAGMQIPIAILLDRYGTQYIIFFCAILSGLSMFIFTNTDNWYIACLSRFFIGAGSAVGFLGVSKIVAEWFPKEKFSKMIGFSFTIGLIGAIYGGKPISLLADSYSFKMVSFSLTCISIVIGITAYLFIRKPQNSKVAGQNKFYLQNMKKLLSTPIIWILAIANLLMVGALEGFADVWGIPYLMKAYTYEKANAAELVSFIFVGMLVGGPLLAAMSKHLSNYLVIILCGLGLSLSFFLLLSGILEGWYGLSILFFIIGIMCCYQVIVFAAGASLTNIHLLSVTIAFLNCINMLGGSFFHTLIGFFMDFFEKSVSIHDGLLNYSVATYKLSLMVIPICSLLGTALVIFLYLIINPKEPISDFVVSIEEN